MAIIALPLFSLSQSGYIGDLINLKYGAFGLERVKDVTIHTNTKGYFYIMPESLCVVDTIVFMPGQRPVGASQYMHLDTLFAGIAYPFQIKSIKLTHGRCLLYKNKP